MIYLVLHLRILFYSTSSSLIPSRGDDVHNTISELYFKKNVSFSANYEVDVSFQVKKVPNGQEFKFATEYIR